MTSPQPTVRFSTQPPSNSETLLVVAATSHDAKPAVHAYDPDELLGDLGTELAAIGFRGRPDELVRIAARGNRPALAVVGLGSDRTATSLRGGVGAAVRKLRGIDKVAISVSADSSNELQAIAEGAALGSYTFDRYRSTSCPPPPRDITIHSSVSAFDSDGKAEHTQTVAEAVALVKDLVNTPAADLFPQKFAEIAEEQAAGLPIDVTVWDEDALEKDGCAGLLGVGRGSARPPRLVKISYSPDNAKEHIALVGKGITFDTGGLSLKPAKSMLGMKYDMTGAATVLAVVLAAAKLRLNIRLTAWLCLAENMPSGTATRPGDILTMKNGKTVEVTNTDAEGRLVLADGLVSACAENPDAIIDVATLTGAATLALGTRYVGVMGDETLASQIVSTGNDVGENLWHMPLPSELRRLFDSDIADMTNANMSVVGPGMLSAAVFLREFIGTRDDGSLIPWAHLDIAGTAATSSSWGFTAEGPTGTAVRTLLALAETHANA